MPLASVPEQLIRQCRDGDAAAFEQLCRLIQGDIYRIVYSFMRDHDDADEVMQESLIRIYKHIHTLKEPEKFPSWTMRIIVNQCYSHRSRKSRRAFSSIEDIVETEDVQVMFQNSAPTPRDRLAQKELMEAIQSAIAQLPKRQRMAILLFEVQGLSIRETAESMECSEGAIKFNIHQARKKLQKALAAEWHDWQGHRRSESESVVHAAGPYHGEQRMEEP